MTAPNFSATSANGVAKAPPRIVETVLATICAIDTYLGNKCHFWQLDVY
ncbi:hypothetical protein [Bosea sp. 685]|nr:hypothetical protein [Bosea sp. 685]WNJ88041.1 hypothetical protein RMR04_00400 [Bosea sp. 685]